MNDKVFARLPRTWRGDVLQALAFVIQFAVVMTGFDVILEAVGWFDDGARPLRELVDALVIFLVLLTPVSVWQRRRERRREQGENKDPTATGAGV